MSMTCWKKDSAARDCTTPNMDGEKEAQRCGITVPILWSGNLPDLRCSSHFFSPRDDSCLRRKIASSDRLVDDPVYYKCVCVKQSRSTKLVLSSLFCPLLSISGAKQDVYVCSHVCHRQIFRCSFSMMRINIGMVWRVTQFGLCKHTDPRSYYTTKQSVVLQLYQERPASKLYNISGSVYYTIQIQSLEKEP